MKFFKRKLNHLADLFRGEYQLPVRFESRGHSFRSYHHPCPSRIAHGGLSVMLQVHGSAVVHNIVDKLIVCNGLTSVHGHAQIGRAEREEDQAEERSDAGEICGDFRV
jgi:hypothetical protein